MNKVVYYEENLRLITSDQEMVMSRLLDGFIYLRVT